MSEPKRLEIHSHTTVSDGSHSPAELAELMAEHGVDLWALTDHDTVGGCRAGYRAATDAGVEFLPGIEITVAADDDAECAGDDAGVRYVSGEMHDGSVITIRTSKSLIGCTPRSKKHERRRFHSLTPSRRHESAVQRAELQDFRLGAMESSTDRRRAP